MQHGYEETFLPVDAQHHEAPGCGDPAPSSAETDGAADTEPPRGAG
ncbi:hypothetical protein SZN_30222 [Streptomyces zinciresistens K42]|uniref:Uncharacterized protein n=1 Tax=Streptomyces zinciresistens K42 TaxID=700597 RepID=G2GKK1_9ACTN|nr:hypothetical protein SZN_30222 [Streptomyces zinciresistens K42]